MTKFLKNIFPILLILGVALLLRLFMWDFVPARLTVDEMSIGYNAYSILETGKDEWGRRLPLVFEAFGDFKLPLYIYLSIPVIAVMGLTLTSVKVISLLSGMVFVTSVYVIARQMFASKNVAVMSALVAAISPWAVHISRQGLESNLALALFSVGLAIFFQSVKKKRKVLALLSGILLGLTFYSYVAYRLTVTLVVILMIIIYRSRAKTMIKNMVVGLAICILPLLPSLLSDSGVARAKHVSIFTDPGIVSSVNENRSFCFIVNPKLNTVCKVLFNKPQEITDRFVKNYVSFFSPEFLFLNGDLNEYLGNPGYGEYFWFMIVFMVVGGIGWLQNKKSEHKLMLGILFVAPLAGALAGSAQMVRGSMLLLPLSLFIGYGAHLLLKALEKYKYSTITTVGLVGFVGFFMASYFVNYFFIYPAKHDYAAYQMPLQVTDYLKKNEDRFELVYINDYFSDAHMAISYFLQLDPSWYQKNVMRPDGDSFGFSHPISLGKYVFGADEFDSVFCENLNKEGVYISSQSYKGYFDEEYRNYSGVHTQARVITFSGMRADMELKGNTIEEKCGESVISN